MMATTDIKYKWPSLKLKLHTIRCTLRLMVAQLPPVHRTGRDAVPLSVSQVGTVVITSNWKAYRILAGVTIGMVVPWSRRTAHPT